MSPVCSALSGTKNERVALTDMSVNATLHDLLSEVTVRQTYRNLESVNIEAVYTFPLPLDAQLLNLEVRLGDRVLQGVVTERHEAERRYEDAVADGDAAVMLEMLEPGLYSMNVGNLLPNETATVTVTYSMMYRWSGDRLRVFIPTVIAERYGATRFQPHQTPESSMFVENAFSLQLEVRGALREARFASPSHSVTLAAEESRTLITLRAERAVMDRDFVLEVTAPRAVRSFAMSGADGEGLATIASFQPFFAGLVQPRAISLGLVIDCSGSMQGMSIQQAKRAIDEILRQLGPGDRVSIVAFGTHLVSFSERLESCIEGTMARARAFVQSLDANMGGTEIGNALEASIQTLRAEPNADVFLVTDGQVSDWENVVANARKTGHRFFTVGVGSAVAEAFVRELASRTGGASELVSPNEGMSDRVVRHFERIRAPRAKRAVVRWPAGARDVFPSQLESVFEGDTIVASARFERAELSGEVVLELETDEGAVSRLALPLRSEQTSNSRGDVSTIARVAAAMRLATLDESTARGVALRYRLTSRFTNWLVVAERAEGEKSQQLPALRKVPQVQVSGMGGMVAMDVSFARVAPSPVPSQAPRSQRRVDRSFSSPRDIMPGAVGGASSSKSHTGEYASAAKRESDSAPPLGARLAGLLVLINALPKRVLPDESSRLLEEAGFGDLLQELSPLALSLNISVGDAASMALTQLLNFREAARALSREGRQLLVELESRFSSQLKQLASEVRGPSLVERVAQKVFHRETPASTTSTVERDSRHQAIQSFLARVANEDLWR